MPEKYRRSARKLQQSRTDVKTRIKLFKDKGRWLAALLFAVGTAMSVQGQTTHAATTTANAAARPAAATNGETLSQAKRVTLTTTSQAATTQPAADPKQAQTSNTQPAAPQTDASTVVTTKDTKGDYSVDPTKTGDPKVSVTQDNMANYFTATNHAGDQLPINGNDVQLTTGHEPEVDANGNTNYARGTGLVIGKQQVDFESDFALNTTVSAKWDSSMGDWLGGDGMSLFFENVQPDQASKDIATGSGMGISPDASKVLAFNVSTNAIQQSPASYTDPQGTTHTDYPRDHWLLYESGQDTRTAIDEPLQTGIAVNDGNSGQMTYTFDLQYSAANQTVTTKVYDASGNLVQTWEKAIPADWIGEGFTLGVTGNTAGSHAAYNAGINSFTYTAATTTLSVTSSGLPSGSQGPDQNGIAGLVGDVVAFYPAGTAAPTEDADGAAVTAAYAVQNVGKYQLKTPQFIRLSDKDNTINLPFTAKSAVQVQYVDDSGNTIKSSATLSGWSGDRYSVTAPAIDGYNYTGIATGSAPLDGKYTDDDQTVVLVYTPLTKTQVGTPISIDQAQLHNQGYGPDGKPEGQVPDTDPEVKTEVGEPVSITKGELNDQGYTDNGYPAGHVPTTDPEVATEVGVPVSVTPAQLHDQGYGPDGVPEGQVPDTGPEIKTEVGVPVSVTPAQLHNQGFGPDGKPEGVVPDDGVEVKTEVPTPLSVTKDDLAKQGYDENGLSLKAKTPAKGSETPVVAKAESTQPSAGNANGSSSSSASQKAYPATGDKSQSGIAAVGAAMVALFGALGLAGKRRKEN